MWKITYFDVKEQTRVWYMQTGFEYYHLAVKEHNLLIHEEKKHHEYHRNRIEFKVELIKQKK